MARLQKVIASSGVTSRRKAEQIITAGKVKVNGEVVTELGTKVTDKDRIEVENVLIAKEVKEDYLLNKPRGVVTTTSDDSPVIVELSLFIPTFIPHASLVVS